MLSPEGVPLGTEIWSDRVPKPETYKQYVWYSGPEIIYQYLKNKKRKEHTMDMVENLEKQVEETEAFEASKKEKKEEFVQNPDVLGTEEE